MVWPSEDTSVASWPLTIPDALSRFSLITTCMPRQDKMGTLLATAAQGMLLRVSKSSSTTTQLSLRAQAGDHDDRLRVGTKGLVEFIVQEKSSATEDATFLIGCAAADWAADCRPFPQSLVLLVYYPELLVGRVLDCILLGECLVVQDGNGVGHSTPHCLQGCCCCPSPAITTTGRQFRRLSVPATMLKDAGDTKDASSTTTMSKRFKEKFTLEDWAACMGIRKGACRELHSRCASEMDRYPWARRATGTATRSELEGLVNDSDQHL